MIHSILMLLASVFMIVYGDRTDEIGYVIAGFVSIILSTIHLYFIAEVELNRS